MGVTERLVEAVVQSDVALDGPQLRHEIRRVAAEEAPLAGDKETQQVVDALSGLGPIEVLLRDHEVSDVLVNGPGEIWVERSGSLTRTEVAFSDAAAIVAAVERVVAPLGLRLDRSSPTVDARLADGSRLHAIVPPAAVDGPIVAVRRFTEAVTDLDELEKEGSITHSEAEFLANAVRARRNVLVSGGTGAGKTTLLNLLSKAIPAGERVVSVEDAAELNLSGHVVRLESRPANSEGAGEITVQALVRHALRLRPDRIIVGEVRGPEALDMIQAMTTGHDGSMSTVHASDPNQALLRLETLALSGDRRVSESTLRKQLWGAVDVVVQVQRSGGQRRLTAIMETTEDGELTPALC